MKFFWKIYFSFTILLLLSFGLFGTWMIQLSFEKSYQRALVESERENRMFQLSFEMNMNALDKIYRNEEIIPVTASSVIENLSNNDSIYRIYNSSQELLYENFSQVTFQDTILDVLNEDAPCGYQLVRKDEMTYLVFACRSVIDRQEYFLENIKNISNVYAERESYYDWYTMIMLILAVVVTVLVFVVTHMLTRSIASLSQITRRFANGDYEVRAAEKGGDEIAQLACDFNDMADTISDKIDELAMQAKRQEDFTASFAHELKTPLTSIIGYADMLRTMECTKEEMLEAVNYIFHQGKRLESLSFKLLELIVTDRQEYAFRPLSLTKLVDEAIQITEIRRREKLILLNKDYEEMLVEGEKDLLISVFTNLLDNAAKAVEPGDVIQIRGRQYGEQYLFCVIDNGCGMEQQDISRITEAFYMVDKSRARKEGGAGLGMTLTSRILGIHKIRWKIFSIPGKGTAVALRFGKKKNRGGTEHES